MDLEKLCLSQKFLVGCMEMMEDCEKMMHPISSGKNLKKIF